MIKVLTHLRLKFSSKKMSPATSTYQFRFLPYLNKFAVKFPHNPILHYAFSSWIEKTMTKTIHYHIGKTDLFYNSMRLCGNFTKFASIWRECYSYACRCEGDKDSYLTTSLFIVQFFKTLLIL